MKSVIFLSIWGPRDHDEASSDMGPRNPTLNGPQQSIGLCSLSLPHASLTTVLPPRLSSSSLSILWFGFGYRKGSLFTGVHFHSSVLKDSVMMLFGKRPARNLLISNPNKPHAVINWDLTEFLLENFEWRKANCPTVPERRHINRSGRSSRGNSGICFSFQSLWPWESCRYHQLTWQGSESERWQLGYNKHPVSHGCCCQPHFGILSFLFLQLTKQKNDSEKRH